MGANASWAAPAAGASAMASNTAAANLSGPGTIAAL
jgi:hypothetical protein